MNDDIRNAYGAEEALDHIREHTALDAAQAQAWATLATVEQLARIVLELDRVSGQLARIAGALEER